MIQEERKEDHEIPFALIAGIMLLMPLGTLALIGMSAYSLYRIMSKEDKNEENNERRSSQEAKASIVEANSNNGDAK